MVPVTTRFFSWLLAVLLLLAAPFALAAPTTPTEDFTDNLDGTVTHRITGLTWMRCAMGKTWDGTTCTGTAGSYTWDEATKLTANFAGKSDWRLPSIAELNSIVERAASKPSINSTIFPNTPDSYPHAQFWSASPGADNSGLPWFVYFEGGSAANSGGTGSYLGSLRLVRSGLAFDPLALYTPSTDFFDNTDGTVTHIKTGLMWKRCAEGQSWSGSTCSGDASIYDWRTAIALTSSSAGHSDWRIPSGNELLTLVEYRTNRTAINTAIFPNVPSSYFWSGSQNARNSDFALVVGFESGYAYDFDIPHGNVVRLVRDGQFFGTWGFGVQADVTPGSVLTSNVLKVAPGGGADLAISVVGGNYAINGGAYTAAAGTAHPNDSITMRVTSAPGFATTSRATLTVGGRSGNFSVTTRVAPESQPPSVPTNLTAVATSDKTVNLTWSVATDNVGVTSYRVYRNGNWLVSLGAVTSFTDTGLTPGSAYSYSVAACDAANNCSAQSLAQSATTNTANSIISVPTTPTRDFTDNGDGTVTHRTTGLTWMRCAMGLTWTGTTCTGTASTFNWNQATRLTANYAGKSDWRLPGIAELSSIVERDSMSPAINGTIFPNTSSSHFWSHSPLFGRSEFAWFVNFSDGSADDGNGGGYNAYNGTIADYYAVRLVRGGQSFDPLAPTTPSLDFFDNSDGTITHLKTGLMWNRCVEGMTWSGTTCSGVTSEYDWRTAVTLTSNSAGHSDWRIPTENELLSIVEYRAISPAINLSIFPQMQGQGANFWSGSPYVRHSSRGWLVHFYNGVANAEDESGSPYEAVRLVRSGQFFGSWGFQAQYGLSAKVEATSNALKVYGSGGVITITNGQYAINGGPYTATRGTINANDTVTVRVNSATTPVTTTRAILTIGAVSGDFAVTTAINVQAPPPTQLSATAGTSPAGTPKVKLTWFPSSYNGGITYYRLYRNGTLLTVFKTTSYTTSYTDTQPANSSQLTYVVQACDAAYNCSMLSSTASATLPGTTSIAPQLSAGAGHSAGIKNDGSLFAWGFNEAGQLGTGVAGDPRTSPQRPSGSQDSSYTNVATGGSHTLAIKRDGSLWSWGGNASGQLGDGSTSPRTVPNQIGTGYRAVASGNNHSVGLKTDGTLWAWGNNGSGQLGDGTSNSASTPIQIGTGFYTVSAGTSHTVAIKTDGTLWAWGSNNFGQLGDGTGNERYSPNLIGSGFTAVAAGAFHTLAFRNDGTLWAWGKNDSGQLGDTTTQNRYAPVQVGSGYSVTSGSLAAGNVHSLALKLDGSLWAWGSNGSGQLGDGTNTNSMVPKAIDPANLFTTLAANGNHSLAMKPDGTVWSWGANSTGQLGDATLASRQSSVLVLNETVDGALDLVPEIANSIPEDKLPSFLVQVAKSSNVTSTVKYNPNDLNQTGSVYIVAYLRPDSPLLLPSVNPTSKSAGGLLTKDTGCPANTAGTIPAVLTRGGWKQTDCISPTLPLYTGTLDTANNTFGMYDSSQFDQTKDNGLFCVGYAGASAKGLIRSVVSGVDANLNICPPIQLGTGSGGTADIMAPSIPLNITATAAGPGQVNLNWNAAADNTAVVRYNIYRGTTLIATLDNVTSYTDSSPQASAAYSYSVMACDAAANCSGQSTPAQTATPALPSVTLGAGWNLVGNGGNTTMNVQSLFGDANKVLTVWKWVKAGSTPHITYPAWAFYTPLQSDGGVAYAASNGFDAFTTIASGEGFWVHAKTAFSVPVTAPAWILSNVFAPSQSKALTPGWNLIATGEAQTASAFNKAMSTTPPTVGVIPTNLTSLWAWQSSVQRWYFYAPSLDSNGGLGAYLSEHNYLDLGHISFTPTMGFWVNRP